MLWWWAGMCDNLTLWLGQNGYNSLKLVLFGRFEDLFPWCVSCLGVLHILSVLAGLLLGTGRLLRRMDENKDAAGAMMTERSLLTHELKRRTRGALARGFAGSVFSLVRIFTRVPRPLATFLKK